MLVISFIFTFLFLDGKRLKSRENASFAWAFFDLCGSNEELAYCQICKRQNIEKKYKHGGSTSNLINHLWKKHRIDKDTLDQRVFIY